MPQINPQQVGGGIVFATPTELITKALQDIGVIGFGMPATSGEIYSGMQTLNAMLDMWGVLRENVSVRTSENFPFVVNQGVYGIGQGSSDFDTVRPIKIESAYYRDVNNSDFPLDCTMDEDSYSAINIKNLPGTPQRLFYKPIHPIGLIYFDYAPSTAWTLYINSWKPFTKITDPSDMTQLSYPDGFEAAILFNLEELLCPANKKSCPPELSKAALMSLQGIQAAYGETPVMKNLDVPGVRGRKDSFFDMGGGR